MTFSLLSTSGSSDPSATSATIAELRAECDQASTDARRGVLLHEIGVLEDSGKNEGQAARDLLNAVNVLPDFHEPLERLVVLIERRKSYKNLGKLLDRLAKVAESPEERSRALVALAEFQEDQENDPSAARESLERATQAKGDDVDAWLALERLAAKTADDALRRRALAARADLAVVPAWRALLSLDVAKLHAAAGDVDAAVAALERSFDAKSAVTFAALETLERIGKDGSRPDLVLRAIEARGDLVLRALDGGTDAEANGVPGHAKSWGAAADAWLEAAELYRARGELERATSLYDRAVERLPEDPVARGTRLRVAESVGDTALSSALAQRELATGVKGRAAAALWMRVTEAAASTGDAASALSTLASALAEDPESIPARMLELDLLSASGDPAALAQALEAAATHLGSEALAAQFFLLAADTAARGAGDVNAAKASLSQAAAAGASLDVAARTGRMLASLASDAAWFDESTKRLLATNPPEAERPSLWFEMGRARLLRGDSAGAVEAFVSLAAAPGGAWLGNVLRAYAVSLSDSKPEEARGAPALEALAALTTDTATSRALRVAAALRYRVAGTLDRAAEVLGRLHTEEPSDLVATTALATLARLRDEPRVAADALAAGAASAADPAVRAALDLEAGILRWMAGDRVGAIEVFDAASQSSPEAGSALLAWALRSAQPNDLEARRKALEAATPSEDDAATLAVERFGLEMGSGGERARAMEALAAADGSGPAGAAQDLARALLGTNSGALAARSAEALGMTAASAHVRALSTADAHARETRAAEWSDADPRIAPAVEWFTQALTEGNVEREIASRERLAERFTEPLSVALVASARIVALIAKDDASTHLLPGKDPLAKLTNLEISPPSCSPRRRAAALIDVAPELDEPSRPVAVGLAGWNLLAAGDAASAIKAFRRYVDSEPEDIVGWEGLRAAAELAGDKPLLAEASAALGDLVSDAGQGAELWERAATILMDSLGDAARGEMALSRAVDRDISRHGAFDRLFRIVRTRKDSVRLLELIGARLAVAEDPTEIAKLYWERARALREAGDSEGALESLENVTMLEADHVGALALTGEIYISMKRFEEAAESLARLSALSEAPTQQRLMSGVAAVDLYENRLGRIDKALEVLVKLHESGLSTLPVRERLARAAAKTESWSTATRVLEELMSERETVQGRIDAARLAMAIHRDRLGASANAQRAVERLFSEAPDDGEAVDLVLAGSLPKPLTSELLRRGRDAVRAALVKAPLELDNMKRLAEIARQLDDVQLRQVTLGAVVALGGQSPQILTELSGLDKRVARTPQIAVDESVLNTIRDQEDEGPLSMLFGVLAGTLAEALGPGLAALGVTKKERVRPQDGLPIRNEIASWTGALGIGEFELYVGGRDTDGIFAVATETPSLVVGASVASPLSAAHRAALARELLALKLGTTILRHRDPPDVAALVTAACNVAGVRIESKPYAMLAEFERLLGKELPRRVRRVLPEIATQVESSGADPVSWVRAAKSSLDRMAAIAIGDVSWVLAGTEGGHQGDAPKTAEGKLRASRLLSFVLSPTFFAVREQLGMGVR